jgi:hypothetical protein
MVYDLRQMTSISSGNSMDCVGIPQNGQRIETADYITAFMGYAKSNMACRKSGVVLDAQMAKLTPGCPSYRVNCYPCE